MAKNARYGERLGELAAAAISPTETDAVAAGYRALIERLRHDWLPPLDREDIARVGQLLVGLSRRVAALGMGEYAAVAALLSSMPSAAAWIWPPRNVERALSAIDALYDRCEACEQTVSPRIWVVTDAVRDYLDGLVCIILK